MLRYEGPVENATFRFAAEPLEIGGTVIAGGRSGDGRPHRGRPRREPLSGPRPLRHPPRRPGPPRLRPRHPLLPGRPAGPPGGPHRRSAPSSTAAPAWPSTGPPGDWLPGMLMRGVRSLPVRLVAGRPEHRRQGTAAAVLPGSQLHPPGISARCTGRRSRRDSSHASAIRSACSASRPSHGLAALAAHHLDERVQLRLVRGAEALQEAGPRLARGRRPGRFGGGDAAYGRPGRRRPGPARRPAPCVRRSPRRSSGRRRRGERAVVQGEDRGGRVDVARVAEHRGPGVRPGRVHLDDLAPRHPAQDVEVVDQGVPVQPAGQRQILRRAAASGRTSSCGRCADGRASRSARLRGRPCSRRRSGAGSRSGGWCRPPRPRRSRPACQAGPGRSASRRTPGDPSVLPDRSVRRGPRWRR